MRKAQKESLYRIGAQEISFQMQPQIKAFIMAIIIIISVLQTYYISITDSIDILIFPSVCSHQENIIEIKTKRYQFHGKRNHPLRYYSESLSQAGSVMLFTVRSQ